MICIKNASEDEMYYSADLTINGETFHNVGIKPKGSASLSAIKASDKSDRFSFKVKTDKFVDNQKIYGLSKFVLNNNIGDATSMKEYFSYDMLNNLGVPTPGYAYANITLNGEPWGLYLAVESLQKPFMKRNFDSKNGNLYKVEDYPVPEGQLQEFGDSLKYKDDDIESPLYICDVLKALSPYIYQIDKNYRQEFKDHMYYESLNNLINRFNFSISSDASGIENIMYKTNDEIGMYR